MNEKSNKLISLLVSLDRSQRRNCRKLILSPWFSGNGDLLRFFDEINTRLDKGKSLSKREIWTAVFKKEKAFNDVRFRKYSSDLFKLVQEFLTQEMLSQEPALKDYLYLAALEKQHPDKLVKGVERNWDRLTGEEESYEAKSYLYRHLLEHRKYSLLNYEHRPYEKVNMERINHSLDVYYITLKLRFAVNIISRVHSEDDEYQLHLVPEIIRFLDRTQAYLHLPIVAIHYYMYKMSVETDNHDAYFKYKDILMNQTDDVVLETAYDLFQPALNYCSFRINEGKKEFYSEYLEVYRYGLSRELVYDDGVLDPSQFRNTIMFALRNGDFEWTEHYIANYQDRLPEKQRANSVTYNTASLYFYQKDYDKALDYLRNVDYENVVLNLNSKVMLLAIYFETEADIALDSLFESLIAYLNRHKELPESVQQGYRNLVLFTRRLSRMLPGDEKAIAQIKADLSAKKYVASRPWLEEKITEFAQL